MEIPVDPEQLLYGQNCNICFAPSFTPFYIYFSYTGILRGDLWAGGDPDPPNEIYKLDQIHPCIWEATVNGLKIVYNTGLGQTIVGITHPAVGEIFGAEPAGNCLQEFINDHQVPHNRKYYSGSAYVTWIEPPEYNSLSALCDLFNIPQNNETTALPYPVDPDQYVVKLQNFTENIKISIKRDFA